MHLTIDKTVRRKELAPFPPPYTNPYAPERDEDGLPPISAEPPRMPVAERPLLMTAQEVSALEIIHYSFGRVLPYLDEFARKAIACGDDLGRAFCYGTPRAFRTIPRESMAEAAPFLWSAEIVPDAKRQFHVTALNVHACHRHAGIIARAASAASPHSLTTTERLQQIYRGWIAGRGMEATTCSTDAWAADDTDDPLEEALRAMIRRVLPVRYIPNAPVQSVFRLPLRHRRTRRDAALIQSYADRGLESFVHPNWRLSHLASLAFLFSERYAREIPGPDLIAARLRAAETWLAPNPDAGAWERIRKHPGQWVARTASPFTLQHVVTEDLDADQQQFAEAVRCSPGKFILQQKIAPLETKVAVDGTVTHAPIRLVTLAYGEELIAAAAVARVETDRGYRRVVMNADILA